MITIEMFLFDNQCFIQWFLILCIGSNLKEKRLEQFTSKIEQTFNLRLVKKKDNHFSDNSFNYFAEKERRN